jgi:hypothetical protein
MVKLWREMRGSALWDGVKWLWCAGGSAVTVATQAVLGFLRGHQDVTALLITGVTVLILAGVALAFDRNKKSLPLQRTPDDKGQDQFAQQIIRDLTEQLNKERGGASARDQVIIARDQTIAELKAQLQSIDQQQAVRTDLENSAPRFTVRYESNQLTEMMVFSTDKDITLNQVGALMSERTQAIELVEIVHFIQGGSFERCRIRAYDIHDTRCKLLSVVEREKHTTHSPTIYYDDRRGHSFAQTFTPVRHGDLIDWKPQGQAKLQLP